MFQLLLVAAAVLAAAQEIALAESVVDTAAGVAAAVINLAQVLLLVALVLKG